MSIQTLAGRVRARVTGDDRESGFALLFSMFLIFVVASLSIAVAGIVYNQVQPTQYQRKNIATVNAANAGLQISLNQIRAASTVTGGTLVGVLQQLRCTGSTGATFTSTTAAANGNKYKTASGATFAGFVNANAANPSAGQTASGGTLRYQTSVAYYTSDPSDQSLDWLATNAMACPLKQTPGFAYLQTHGLVNGESTVSGDRTQHATYTFLTTNTNVQGGRLVSFGSSPAMCLDATGSPAANVTPVVKPCLALGTPSQSWSYRSDLTLFYQGNPSLNLCIQAPSSNGSVTLQACAPSTVAGVTQTYPYLPGNQQAQEWSFNDSGHFTTAGGDGNVTGTCLQPSGQADSGAPAASGTALVTTGCTGGTDSLNAWNPDPQVGAGKAGGNTTGVPGAPTNQYVNYAEFGRCLDITGQNVNADHLIDYPCKQAPNAAYLAFNQKWTYTASSTNAGYGAMSVTTGGVNYCLTAPASASDYYVVVSANGTGTNNCLTSPTDSQLWQATGKIDNYQASYELVSRSLGLCMSASTAPNGDLTPNSSNIIVETCNGTLREKWNAPPNPPAGALNNVGEDSGNANTLP